jgi:hypothetical protein
MDANVAFDGSGSGLQGEVHRQESNADESFGRSIKVIREVESPCGQDYEYTYGIWSECEG